MSNYYYNNIGNESQSIYTPFLSEYSSAPVSTSNAYSTQPNGGIPPGNLQPPGYQAVPGNMFQTTIPSAPISTGNPMNQVQQVVPVAQGVFPAPSAPTVPVAPGSGMVPGAMGAVSGAAPPVANSLDALLQCGNDNGL